MKITFIGGGNMATALIGGMKKQGFSAAGIQVVEPAATQRETLTESFGVRATETADAAALNCEVLVLAVKPQMMREAISPLAGRLDTQLVVSIAAGLRIADISRWLGDYPTVVRCMPNTPALIGAGITGLYAAPAVGAEARGHAERILRAVGSTLWIDNEAQMDAITAISGSGPAYVFYFLEAMQSGAEELGFSPAESRRLAIETFIGAAQLAGQSDESLATLRERVTSRGGTTAAALDAFNRGQGAATIRAGIAAAALRSRELGDILGTD